MDKINIVFCCHAFCMKKEMDDFLERNFLKNPVKLEGKNIIVCNGTKNIFFVDINRTPGRLKGIKFHHARTCGNYNLSDEVKKIIEHNKQ